MLNIPQPISLFFLALGAMLAWTSCRWWYQRQLKRLASRVAKLHADREMVQEQVKQARLQVSQLQKEVTTWRNATAPPLATRVVPAIAEPEVKSDISMHQHIPRGLVFEVPQTAAHGFADTMPFDSGVVA